MKNSRFGEYLPRYLPNPKKKFNKIYIYIKVYLSYFQLTKKAKAISSQVFKIMNLKTYNKETKKRYSETLRPIASTT